MHTDSFSMTGLPGFPTIAAGDRLAPPILAGVAASSLGALRGGDVIAVASKIVSIEEDRRVDLTTITPGPEALALSATTGKDPRGVELILRESTSHFLAGPRGPIIARHRLGLQLTSAGVDRDGADGVILLPEDPDASAARLLAELRQASGVDRLGLVIADSDGRPDRGGSTVIAIGSAGIAPLRRTTVGEGGREKVQEETLVDLIAGAAGIILGQRGRGMPVAVLRGLAWEASDAGMGTILHG